MLIRDEFDKSLLTRDSIKLTHSPTSHVQVLNGSDEPIKVTAKEENGMYSIDVSHIDFFKVCKIIAEYES